MEVKCFNPKCDGGKEDLRYVAQEVQYFAVEELHPRDNWYFHLDGKEIAR